MHVQVCVGTKLKQRARFTHCPECTPKPHAPNRCQYSAIYTVHFKAPCPKQAPKQRGLHNIFGAAHGACPRQAPRPKQRGLSVQYIRSCMPGTGTGASRPAQYIRSCMHMPETLTVADRETALASAVYTCTFEGGEQGNVSGDLQAGRTVL